MDHLTIILEHVHLLNGGDVRHTNPLESRRQLLVICNSDRS